MKGVTGERLDRLRNLFNRGNSSYQALIVPSSDAHQSEYLADCDKRREYISGFTGSAGTAVITAKHAALWTDGRYFLQANKELDENWTLMKAGVKGTPEIKDWLKKVLPVNSSVGCNSTQYSSGAWMDLQKSLQLAGHELVPTDSDLIDEIWKDKPGQPMSDLMIVDDEVAGVSISNKLDKLRASMKEHQAEWLIVTSLDDVAWLLNMRGADIEYNPVFFSYVIIGLASLHIFIQPSRCNESIRSHLSAAMATMHDYDDVFGFIRETCSKSPTLVARNSSFAVISCIEEKNRIVLTDNPVASMKAVKNSREIAGMKKCNVTDAVALCRFFHWMEQEVPKGKVTECSAAQKSLQFRSEGPEFVSLSFETISSSGPTGSIIHYKPNPDDDKPVLENQIYLVDSGGQYKSGTTDTTRTVHFGQPTSYERECFTRVLKGHIGLASAIFPARTKGYALDTLARTSLWRAGLDFRHGTGHGVGCFLNVHEGPVGIYIGNSPRITKVAEDVDISDGMFITNEPGYYEDGKFGIRIENLMLCVKADTKYRFGDQQYYGFETVALVPIQRKMIEVELLTPDEIAWLNEYHSTCREVIGAELKSRGYSEVYQWLIDNTNAI